MIRVAYALDVSVLYTGGYCLCTLDFIPLQISGNTQERSYDRNVLGDLLTRDILLDNTLLQAVRYGTRSNEPFL